MSTKLSSVEIRRRALRAAGQVALWSTLACGGEAVTGSLGSPELELPPPAEEQPFERVETEARVANEVLEVETATATAEICHSDWEDYLACCERIGWDWNRGCAAWGPPVPPALEVA